MLRNQLLLVAFAYQTIRRFIIPAVHAAELQQRAEIRLRYIMVEKNKLSEETFFLAKQRAKSLQAVTGYSDEQILSMQSAIETMDTLSRIEKDKLIPLALDLARASERATGEQVTLDRVMKTLMRAMTGSSDSLKELNIGFQRFPRGAIDAGQMIVWLEEEIGGLALRTDDFGSKIRMLKADMGDLAEEIGERLMPAIEELMGNLKIHIAYLKELGEKQKLENEARELGIEIKEKEQSIMGKLADGIKWLFAHTSPLLILYKKKQLAEVEATIAMIEEKKVLLDLIKEKREDIEATKAQIEGLLYYINQAREAMNTFLIEMGFWKTMQQKITTGLKETWSSFFFDVFMVEMKTAADYFDMFTKSILKAFSNMLAKMLVETIKWEAMMAAIKAAFGAVGIGAPTKVPGAEMIGSQMGVRKFQHGGVVPRFQRGGVVPALLEPGEGIITRKAMAGIGAEGLERINRGEGAGKTTINQYYINAIDVKTFRQYLAENEDLFRTSVYGDIEENGSLRKLFRSGI